MARWRTSIWSWQTTCPVRWFEVVKICKSDNRGLPTGTQVGVVFVGALDVDVVPRMLRPRARRKPIRLPVERHRRREGLPLDP